MVAPRRYSAALPVASPGERSQLKEDLMIHVHARRCGGLAVVCACSANAQTVDGPAIGWGEEHWYRGTQNTVPQSPLPPIPSGRFKAVSAGFNFTLYLVSSTNPAEDGTILFRGQEHPQLNEPGELRDHVPSGPGYTAVSAGYAHCMAIDSSGYMRAWGCNVDNQFAARVPEELVTVKVSAIAAGENLSAALRADPGHERELVTWGRSDGHYAAVPFETLVAPGGIDEFTEISAHGHHIVARTINGDLFAWGAQLSDWGQVFRFNQTPLDPQGRPWGAFSAGHWHTVVLDQDGVWYEPNPNPTAFYWGHNGCGQGTSSCTASFPGCNAAIGIRPPPCALPAFVRIEGGYYGNTGLTQYGWVITWGAAPAFPPSPASAPPPPPYRIRTLSSKFYHGIGIQTCYANCDGSTTPPVLNVQDFNCFMNSYNDNDPAANCDGSTTEPILTFADFQCFQNKFTAGCSAP